MLRISLEEVLCSVVLSQNNVPTQSVGKNLAFS